MGWTFTHKPKGEPVTDFLTRHGCLRWSEENTPWRRRVLASAVVNLKEFYAAVEDSNIETGQREVWCAVFMLDYTKDHYNFGYKDMEESMGPFIASCPERILDLLTPTDNVNANEWRQRCRDRIASRKALAKVAPGCTVVLYGKRYEVTATLGKNGFSVRSEQGVPYRLSHARARFITEVIPA